VGREDIFRLPLRVNWETADYIANAADTWFSGCLIGKRQPEKYGAALSGCLLV